MNATDDWLQAHVRTGACAECRVMLAPSPVPVAFREAGYRTPDALAAAIHARAATKQISHDDAAKALWWEHAGRAEARA